MINPFSDEYFMKQAFAEAEKAFSLDEVPVGAVVVCNNQVIARAHNLSQQLTDVTAHAEMQAITAAANHLGGKYLKKCTLYVTLEPCVMCAGALFWSQIDKVVYGADDPMRGAGRFEGLYHPKTELVGGVLKNQCAEIVQRFFEKKR